MNKVGELIEIVKKNNGVIRTTDVLNAGLHHGYIRAAIEQGKLYKISNGIYSTSEAMPDKYYALQLKWQKAVFSYATAAYFNGLTTRDPLVIEITVPSSANVTKLREQGYKPYFINNGNYELGLTEVKTMFGNLVKVYDKERTICDLFSKKYKGDQYIAIESFKTYVADKKNRDFIKLMKYAKVLGVEKEIASKLEVMV
ncbi:MAG: type IV toxin-antitoxin system AbiEi family antitoxin domain-containing protein [Christensenellaceae bacterium]|nr:type IV toxin-antitoxin system AbiEi family antitoxin domain-containing protein [Christensenellaceae bacterium]